MPLSYLLPLALFLAQIRSQIGISPVSQPPISSHSSSELPGMKLAIIQKSFDYMVKQLTPLILHRLQHFTMATLFDTVVKTPVGALALNVTDFEIAEIICLTEPELELVNPWLFRFSSSVGLFASGKWSYREVSYPHVSDSGTMEIGVSFSIVTNVGARTNASFSSGLEIITDGYFEMSISSLTIKLKGGSSWLYNIFMHELKPMIEKAIILNCQVSVMKEVMSEMQKQIDLLLGVDVEIYEGIGVSFQVESYYANVISRYLSIGVKGEFQSKGIVFPGEPRRLPDEISDRVMLSLFVSQWSVESAAFVVAKTGVLVYVLTSDDVPPSWPFKLETSWFATFVPEIEQKFGDKKMQIEFVTNPDAVPEFQLLETGVGMTVHVLSRFQVLVDSNSSVVTAFTIDLGLGLNCTLNISKSNQTQGYVISGVATLRSLTMNVTQSVVGQIRIPLLDSLLNFLAKWVIMPYVNSILGSTGIPLPPIPYLELQETQVLYHSGYVEARADFTFAPPKP